MASIATKWSGLISIAAHENKETELEAEEGIEPSNDGFANHCLTTWLLRRCAWRGGEGLRAGSVGVNARMIGNCGADGGQGVVDFRLGRAQREH